MRKKLLRICGWALIGILVIVVLMTWFSSWGGQDAMNSVRRNAASYNLRAIASAYSNYAEACDDAILFPVSLENGQPVVNSPAYVAEILAKKANLRHAGCWYIDGDPALEKVTIPATVLANGTSGENNLVACGPISWVIVANISKAQLAESNCAIAWTRGLQEDGTWAKDSPWGGAGGHIAFVDGQVRWAWAHSIAELELKDDDGRPITRLSELLGKMGGVMLEDKPNPMH